MKDSQTEMNDQFAARMSAIEFIVEVFAANQLADMRNAGEFIDTVRLRFDRPYRRSGGPIDAAREQQFRETMKEFGVNLANKIEARWREIAGK
jgi:3-mercaptopyruvate sulfurtransferase SseA